MKMFAASCLTAGAMLFGEGLSTPAQAQSPAPAVTAPAAAQPTRAQQLMGDIAPKLADLTENVLFGDVWARAGLSQRDRSLVTVSALIAMNRPEQLRSHLARARDNGVTEQELVDVISYIYYVKLFDEPGDPGLGERWFRDKRCVDCHRVGGAGGRVGPPLDRYARYVAPIVLAEGMWNHGPAMQATQHSRGVPTPTFVGREMADIQAYIRRASSEAPRRAVFLQPPHPERGRQLFGSKGCVRCHGGSGRGTADGPDLRAATLRMRVSEIAGVLWNHSFEMSERMRERGFAFPRFSGTEMADVKGPH